MRQTAFIVSLLFMFNSFGQQVIDVDFEQPSVAQEMRRKTIDVFKPHGERVTYTLRFNGIKLPDFNNKKTKTTLILSDRFSKNTNGSLSLPLLAFAFNSDSAGSKKSDQTLEIILLIPESYLRMENDIFTLYYSYYDGADFFLSTSLDINISCEQPDYYSLSAWEKGIPDDLEVVKVIHKEDHLLVHAHRPNQIETNAYKIRLRAHESFETSTPLAHSKSTLGLIHVPYKARLGVDALTTHSQVSLTNIGVHWGIWNHEKHTYFAHGSATHESWGIGAFILPSLQRVRFVTDNTAHTDLGSYSVKEPFNASFFGFGLTLNYTYNGFGLYLIPFAVDIQTSAEQFHKALHAGRIWFGLGIGYTPRSWKK